MQYQNTKIFKIITHENSLKGMKYYDISFQRNNSSGSEGAIEDAQTYKVMK